MPQAGPEDNTYTLRAALSEALSLKGGRGLTLTGLYGSSKAYILAALFKASARPILAVLPTQEAAEDFVEDLRFFLRPEDVSFYPSTETLPFEALPTHQDLQSQRIEVLFNLPGQRPFVAVSAAANLMQRVIPGEGLNRKVVELEKGVEVPRDEIIATLHEIGYSRMSMVEERGEMSLRGGILDIFPPMYDSPLRVEFFGDEVESIRHFDISTQRSLKELDSIRILPARETTLTKDSRSSARDKLIERADLLGVKRDSWEPLSDKLRDGVTAGMDYLLPLFYEKLDTVFDYLREDALVVMVDPELSDPEIEELSTVVRESSAKLAARRQFFVEPESLYLSADEVRALLKRSPVVSLESFRGPGAGFTVESNLDLRQEISLKKGTELFSPLTDRVKRWAEEGLKVFLTAHNKGQAERTVDLLEGYGLKPPVISGPEVIEKASQGFFIATGSLSTGFRLASESIVVVSEEEVFGERVKRRGPPSKKLDAFLTQLQDLTAGDFIVHAHHGIGLYKGLKRLSIDGVENDFLLLEYRGGDKLYLPVWRMDLVGKYHGFEGSAPELDKLGGPGWEKTRKKVKESVEKLAGELLKLYAERQVAEGFAFSPPDRLFHEFEAGFEYDETPDQARAIEECLKDMEEPRPMDRLVCGDVGYGKTEVAIRAAFKAVLDKKQVAVLVPTTVLAQQHYRTFSGRLSPYPVAVDVLSRFKTSKEQKETVRRVSEGKVDIIIGTHRILQKDIEFKDLGLIVIDEEHRFGVAHKEKLKHMRKKVDVLTLTATPIPRTLHMSLASIRELSIINTPPEDRLAIKTSVIRFDEAVIAEAIERELNRGGQVFFVHNRIQSMGAMEEFLRRIVPRARVAVAHGQMKEGELERKMLGFINKDFDILLSTAIIESGLDIPSANTIIINRADRFGLAELYQLRGRVGRSRHRAYAYFICPSVAELTDDARKRMEVIQELSEPGSGFKVATYDLEIRGAGELLGSAQSGQIASVGFDMYTQLLDEAVSELKGEEAAEEIEPEINLRVSQYIPEEYIPDTRQRLGFYKRLATVAADEELYAVKDELADRYGEPPALVNNLFRIIELKLDLKRLGAREMTQKGTRLYITFQSLGDTDLGQKVVEKALSMAKKEPKRYRVTPEKQFIVFMGPGAEALEESRYVLKELLKG
ncbi:MAG: transcription-repair coupling factor [Deltaproteobacteria bacterium]|nr:transcription-repair coupling factor [Deltaproteobacteria bacterium]